MPYECGKAVMRRLHEPGFGTRYFVGAGLDIGAGPDGLSHYQDLFPAITSVRDWDLPDGDAQLLASVPEAAYDFVHSSHCLEHMRDPAEALQHWFRVVKPLGHLIVLVPDEDLYEQGVWPSTFNSDHKRTFTIHKPGSWSPVSTNVTDLLATLGPRAKVIKLQLLDLTFRYHAPRVDQTGSIVGECAIEFIVRKLPAPALVP
jgi:SAM-dependent methyltransferase